MASDGCFFTDGPVVPDERLRKVGEALAATLRGERGIAGTPKPYPWNEEERGKGLVKIDNPHQTHQGVLELCRDPAVVELALATRAEPPRMLQLWCSQILVKLPNPGAAGAIGWHRDWDYWGLCFAPGSELFTVWLALTDVGEKSGPVCYVRGSHLWEISGPGNFFSEDLVETRGLVDRRDENWTEIRATLPRGGAVVHDWRTIHGGRANTSDSPRAGLAIHLRTERAVPKAGFDPTPLALDDFQRNPLLAG